MFDRAKHRLRQFYRGLFSAYTAADEVFARNYLNSQEMSLFNQLPSFEKEHSVTVARRMQELATYNPELDQRKLVKLGLLHDIGKLSERNSVPSKAILVIFRYFFPRLFDRLAEKGKDERRFHKLYLHKHHGAVGAELLARIGESPEIVSMVKKHDPLVEPFGPGDPIELKILQDADSY